MNCEIQDRVSFICDSKEHSGVVRDKFIQNIELELNSGTEMISATAEDPVYLITTNDDKHFTVKQSEIVKVL